MINFNFMLSWINGVILLLVVGKLGLLYNEPYKF